MTRDPDPSRRPAGARPPRDDAAADPARPERRRGAGITPDQLIVDARRGPRLHYAGDVTVSRAEKAEMRLEFSRPGRMERWNAYLDWAAYLRAMTGARGAVAPNSSGVEEWQPVFARAKDVNMSAKDFFTAAENDPGIRFDAMERALNDDSRRAGGYPVEAVLYLPADGAEARDWYVPMHVGAAVALKMRGEKEAPDRGAARAVGEVPTALGIIDDGIPFLNARFRNSPAGTRIAAIWLQTLAHDAFDKGPSSVQLGRVLRADPTTESPEGIDALLGQLKWQSEHALYRRVNRTLPYGRGLRHTVERAASHGAAVLDLAGGADMGSGDPLERLPIVAVQLPGESIDDTSGIRTEMHAIQALRWLILTASEMGVTRLVVNMSLGVVAGPKDGTRFVERQMVREIEKAAVPVAADGTARVPMTVEAVLPFGNDYDTRLVAALDLPAEGSEEIGLRLQRDDETPGYVEIRARESRDDGVLERLRIGVTDPLTRRAAPVSVPAGAWRGLRAPGGTADIARLYHVPARPEAGERPYLALAFAPTAPWIDNRAPVRPLQAPAGRWRIAVQAGERPCALTLQVQRDDSAAGYVQRGRQAFLDHPAPPDALRSTAFRDFSGLDPAGPVTREGTNNAFATAQVSPAKTGAGAGRVYTVGATRVVPPAAPGGTAEVRPALYTAEGGAWTLAGPDAAAVGETGGTLLGLRAAGTLSGTTARFAGTSVAAAVYSRSRLDPATRKPLPKVPKKDPRLGAVSITESAAVDPRGPWRRSKGS